MTNPIDVMAQVQATMTEALDKIPDHDDVRGAVITICLDTAKRLAATEETWILGNFGLKSSTRQPTSWRCVAHPRIGLNRTRPRS